MARNNTNRRRFIQLTGVTAAGMVAGCLGGGGPDTVTVGPDGENEFEPAELEISIGAEVEFEWDSDGHNIEIVDQPAEGEWDGEPDVQDEGHTYTHTFMADGTYEYVCGPHEDDGMTGTIVVEEPEPVDN